MQGGLDGLRTAYEKGKALEDVLDNSGEIYYEEDSEREWPSSQGKNSEKAKGFLEDDNEVIDIG